MQQAILLYFRLRQMETIEIGPFEYHDKIPLKRDSTRWACASCRRRTARYGASSSRA